MDVKYVMLEPNYKMMFGGHIQTMRGPAEATEDPAQGRKGPRPTNLVLPKASPGA